MSLNYRSIFLFFFTFFAIYALRAQQPDASEEIPGGMSEEITDEVPDDSPGEPLGPPVFPAEMMVSLWDADEPFYFEERDTVPATEYGTCVNYNRLDFRPLDDEDGIEMTWYATASFSNGFYGECTYIYTGTRDLNVVCFTKRRFDDQEDDEAEILDPARHGVLAELFSHEQIQFNNRTFTRVSGKTVNR